MKHFFEKNREKRDAQKARLKRVFQKDENVFRAEAEKNAENTFFWRVASMATLGLFFFSIVPRFAILTGRVDEEKIIHNDARDEIIFLEDGFLKKPEKWTAIGDRGNIGDILEYTVEAGDTLSAIAKKVGVSEKTILQNNPIDKNRLRVGTKLKIPATDGVIYKVRRGDTIGGIAKKYGVPAAKILAQNNFESGDDLKAGAEIIIPGAKKAPPPKKPTGASRRPPKTLARGRETYGKLLFPTIGQYTQGYHYGHYAVDISHHGGGPIFAAESGTVIRADYGWNGGYGNVIIIDHGNGMQTLYAHNKTLYVKKGDRVSRGQQIAEMGNTGNVRGPTGIHLHFEVRVNGRKLNPKNFF